MNGEQNTFRGLEDIKSKADVFNVPSCYFDDLPERILDKVNNNSNNIELISIAPALLAAGKNMPFFVPAGYFEGLDKNVIAKKQKSPFIFLQIRKLATAAIIVGILVSGSIFWRGEVIKNRNFVSLSKLQKGLASLPEDQLKNYLIASEATGRGTLKNVQKNVDTNQFFNAISTKELKSFLDETAAGEEDESYLN